LFAEFLGYNPIEHLVGTHVLGSLPAASRAALAGRSFFPHLISGPFRTGLHEAFLFAILACLIAAGASLLRGGKYHHAEQPSQPGTRGVQGEPREALDDGEAVASGILQQSYEPDASALAQTTTAEEQHAS
jgi:hypothetical protein